MKRNKAANAFETLISLVGGAALFGVAVNMFLLPGKVVMGGATGIATTLNFLFPNLPIGLLITTVNIPLLLMNLRRSGKTDTLKAVAGIIISSAAIDTMTFLPVTLEDPLLLSVLGGGCMGWGAGILLTKGFTTGGSDLAAVMIKRAFKNLSYGRCILFIDGAVVLLSAFVLKSYESVMYSALSIFSYSTVLDRVMGGAERAKLAFVISKRYYLVARSISEKLSRGVTLLHASGWYTGDDGIMLMCVVKRKEVYALKTAVLENDPSAFLFIADAAEVIGEGFKITPPAMSDEKKGKVQKHGKIKRKK